MGSITFNLIFESKLHGILPHKLTAAKSRSVTDEQFIKKIRWA